LLIPLIIFGTYREIKEQIRLIKRKSPVITPTIKRNIFIKRITIGIMTIGLITGFILSWLYILIPYYRDIPYFLSKKYIFVEGYANNKRTYKWGNSSVDINNTTVDFGFLKHPGLIMHKKYKVYYLPHSKEVIMVQESGGNLK
jgi:hypothetical protein